MSGYKLFIDDMRPIPNGWLGARTVSESITVLAQLDVSEVSLDHDIVSPMTPPLYGYQPLMNETFRGVAWYIAALPIEKRPKRIRIHTSNSGAAMTMCEIMGLDFKTTYKRFDPKDYE